MHKNLINTMALFNNIIGSPERANTKCYIKETRYETFTYVIDVFFDEVKAVGCPILRLELHNDNTISILSRWSKDSTINITLSNIKETIENRMFNIESEEVKPIVYGCLVLYKQFYDAYKDKKEDLHTIVLRKNEKDIWRRPVKNDVELTRDMVIERLDIDNEKKTQIGISKIENLITILRTINLRLM